MDASFLKGFLFAAPIVGVVYYTGASLALIALLFCIRRNTPNLKYDSLALILPLLLWLGIVWNRPGADLDGLFVLGCSVSLLSLFRVGLGLRVKDASKVYLVLSLLASVVIAVKPCSSLW
ncbi:hypothetical protein [Pseudomonas sp. GV071]|jgi:hypothetical protein|uniref:hypothetical protein n=1 Tax=Pseudomonas sp. GV071 TaxID=2135754 RepID=UPI000D39E691|nr:hypothetical protein [Pseudomonas sp. GV071]PTQ74141.1 hypothetical protein C8K61_101581 [Pseudomonas sp. GV071]